MARRATGRTGIGEGCWAVLLASALGLPVAWSPSAWAEVGQGTATEDAVVAGSDDPAPGTIGPRKRIRLPRGWRSRTPPTRPEETDDPDVARAILAAPAEPPVPARYVGHDQAIQAARTIAGMVRRFPSFRAAIALGSWRVDPAYAFRVRPGEECRAQLRELGVKVRPFEPGPARPVDTEPTPTPVVVTRAVDGVSFAGFGSDVVVSCELAARLPVMAKVMADHGIDSVMIASSWRAEPRTSFHRMGMGLDITAVRSKRALRGADGTVARRLLVKTDFVETPTRETCDPELLGPDSPLGADERARTLLGIACGLFETGAFSSVLTPNYNPGHRDHFHIDIRPDDPRVFLR